MIKLLGPISIAALIAGSLACFSNNSYAGADDVRFTQRNSTDTGDIGRIPVHPLTPGLLSYNPSSLLPEWVTLGSGLVINSGVLAVQSGFVPVNADWNSSSGLSQILNKPSIPAAQVNSDWNASSGVSQVLNKPSIPAAQVNSDWAAGSGISQILNKPTIPAAQVNSDWNASSGVTAILNKPSIPGAPGFAAPSTRTISFSTAFQATDPTKAAIISISASCNATLTLAGGSVCSMEGRVGSSPLTCSNGTVVALWANGNTGTLTIGIAINQTISSQAVLLLPAGAYGIICPLNGSVFSPPTAVDQSIG